MIELYSHIIYIFIRMDFAMLYSRFPYITNIKLDVAINYFYC